MTVNNASTTPIDGMSLAPAPFEARDASTRVSKVFKTRYGDFWHYEDAGRRRSSYLQTACHRRLGRWHLEPSRSASSVPIDEICAACRTNVPSQA